MVLRGKAHLAHRMYVDPAGEDRFPFLLQIKCQASFLEMAVPKIPARASGTPYLFMSTY